jgi:hypothetical protein
LIFKRLTATLIDIYCTYIVTVKSSVSVISLSGKSADQQTGQKPDNYNIFGNIELFKSYTFSSCVIIIMTKQLKSYGKYGVSSIRG